MSDRFVVIADLIDPDDPEGRTFRQINAAKTHAIPIGTLVEIVASDPDECDDAGVRLFVVHHSRDCDQTPLYCLCHSRGDTEQRRPGFRNTDWICGYAEEDLLVVRSPVQGVPESLDG